MNSATGNVIHGKKMGRWLKLLVVLLMILLSFPFLLTHLLFSATRFESEKAQIKKWWIPALILNLLGNGIVLYCAGRQFFHSQRPWNILRQLLQLQGSWRQLFRLAILVLFCSIMGLLIGFILRRLFLRKKCMPVSHRMRCILLLLCVFCGGTVFTGCEIANRENRHLMITEICRKTNAEVIESDQEDQGNADGEISYVTLQNVSLLDCEFDVLYLSNTEEDLTALSFPNVSISAGEKLGLAMDYNHGLDLKKDGRSTVYLSLNAQTILDQIDVPALAEHEAWQLSDTGTWEIYAYRPVAARTLKAPTFSQKSGFYEEGFDLILSGLEGAEIRYTLDGSDPTENGIVYTKPLHMEDPTSCENIWSNRTDVSAAFLTDNPRFTVPDEPVDKCAIVRAVCENDEGELSPVVTSSYFIGYDGREGYANLGFVSIVTDPANLFSDQTGIYVLGDVYKAKHPTGEIGSHWWGAVANYRQKGRDWEREASVQFFDASGNLQLSSQSGIRIRGGMSAGLIPKSLGLYARKIYSGQNRFDADLFGNGYIAKRVTLAAGGNDVDLKVRDWLTSRLLEDTDVRIVHNRFIPYCVFLDGEYWGNYWLTEQYDDVYFAFAYDLHRENVIVIKNNSLNAGVTGDMKLYNEFRHFFRDNDLSQPGNYEVFGQMVDLEDFAAYYALEMYIANHDRGGLRNNSAVWRTRVYEDAPAGDTRWRWALFDVNSLTCYGDASADTLSYMKKKDKLFAALMKNSEFSKSFYDMLKKYAKEVFTPERAEEALHEYEVLMEAPMNLEHKRFNRNLTGLPGLETIRTFIRERQIYILNLCAAQEDLYERE